MSSQKPMIESSRGLEMSTTQAYLGIATMLLFVLATIYIFASVFLYLGSYICYDTLERHALMGGRAWVVLLVAWLGIMGGMKEVIKIAVFMCCGAVVWAVLGMWERMDATTGTGQDGERVSTEDRIAMAAVALLGGAYGYYVAWTGGCGVLKTLAFVCYGVAIGLGDLLLYSFVNGPVKDYFFLGQRNDDGDDSAPREIQEAGRGWLVLKIALGLVPVIFMRLVFKYDCRA